MAKIITYKEPKSSFMSVDKDMSLIANAMLQNSRLKRLLYYTTPDALERPSLGEEESEALFGKEIKISPKILVDSSVLNYIIISFDNFTTNIENPKFRDNIVSFDVVCHLNQWELKDMKLRPYRIAGEIDSMFNNKHLTGIGTLQFLGANQIILNDEFAGLTLMYSAIHGGEDNNYNQDGNNIFPEIEDKDGNMIIPDEERYKKDFDETYNSDEWIID